MRSNALTGKPGAPTVKVLIADDHAMMRQGLRKLLEDQAGFEVVGEASDGEAAVTMAKVLQPDVILMDVNMPKLDGIAATRKITARKKSPAIIGISVQEGDEIAQQLIQAGARAYLSKREAAEDLCAIIRRHAFRNSISS